jgi:hypothetical protein
LSVSVIVIKPTKPILDTKQFVRDVKWILDESGREGVRFMREYPERMHLRRRDVYGTPFVSDRQRRWFFAALRDGSLVIPRKRTMTLARSWNALYQRDARGASVTIGSNANMAPYNIYVQSEENQSLFMAALGWPTDAMMRDWLRPRFEARLENLFKEMAE